MPKRSHSMVSRSRSRLNLSIEACRRRFRRFRGIGPLPEYSEISRNPREALPWPRGHMWLAVVDLAGAAPRPPARSQSVRGVGAQSHERRIGLPIGLTCDARIAERSAER